MVFHLDISISCFITIKIKIPGASDHLMTWLEIALVKPVHVIKVILGSVRQLEVVSVLVGELDSGVGPQGLDVREDGRLEVVALLRVGIVLDPGRHSVETVNVLTERTRLQQCFYQGVCCLVLRRIESSAALRLLSIA